MENVQKRINQLYEEFKDFPTKNKIVRLNTPNDAFTLLVFEILFNNYHDIQKLNYQEEAHRNLLIQYIVPPPDDSIDIFYEEKDLDEYKYHIVQVKYANLTHDELENCFLKMENSVKTFLKSPKETKKNLREIIGSTDFSKQNKDCIYYVVHKGKTNFIRNQHINHKIITLDELMILEQGRRQMSVPKEKFEIDTANNFIINNFVDKSETTKTNFELPQSLLCNFSGYDLAVLNNKYSQTLLGRNILYGQNLRESLSKKSKTYESMFKTIDNEPELFLFYNNGITILSSDLDAHTTSQKKEIISLENFSIINGAQTTSTLGAYLRAAEVNDEFEKIEKLKKVFVLTKIYKINDELKNHDSISENIKIYNNTQTPLSSRDMVSIRSEQILLQEKLLNGNSPNIFVYIKKGETIPAHPKTELHQRVTNEILAQLSLCGFCIEPFNAKDKKTKIFDNEGKEHVLLNPIYHKLFNPKDGILLNKSKEEIDELLFIYRVHEDTKKVRKDFLKSQLVYITQNPIQKNASQSKMRENGINSIKRYLEITNVCLFFNIACYYEIRNQFDNMIKNSASLFYDTKEYYNPKSNYRGNLIENFGELFYLRTIEIIKNKSGVENINNWIRAEKGQDTFLTTLRDNLYGDGLNISNKYKEFVLKFKKPN